MKSNVKRKPVSDCILFGIPLRVRNVFVEEDVDLTKADTFTVEVVVRRSRRAKKQAAEDASGKKKNR